MLSGLTHVACLVGGEAAVLRAGVVGDLLSTQDPDGYIGGLAAPSRPGQLWDVHEQAYIIQALLESLTRFGDGDAREGAARLGRWLLPRLANNHWRQIDDGRVWTPLAIIGLDRAMLRLTEATGDPTFAGFARDDLGVINWFDPIVEGRQGSVAGHAYAYLARCLAQLEMLDEGDAEDERKRKRFGPGFCDREESAQDSFHGIAHGQVGRSRLKTSLTAT